MATDELLKRLLGKTDELHKRMERLFVSTKSMFDVLDKRLPLVRDSASLKKKLWAKYLSAGYEVVQYLKLTSLSQGTMSVSEYTDEFDKLCFSCDYGGRRNEED